MSNLPECSPDDINATKLALLHKDKLSALIDVSPNTSASLSPLCPPVDAPGDRSTDPFV